MCDFAGFTTKPVKEILKENVDMGGGKKKVGSEGFQDKDFREIRELIDPMPEELTEDNLIEMQASELVPDNKEEDTEEAVPAKREDIRPTGRRVLRNQDCLSLL